jgi:hypothetical protein
MEFIYLIKSLSDSHYKIGVSKNPNRRLKQLQTGNSSEIKLICEYQTMNAYKIEKVLHRRYTHFNIDGEWFDLSIKEEADFLNECAKIEKGFKDLIVAGNVFI